MVSNFKKAVPWPEYRIFDGFLRQAAGSSLNFVHFNPLVCHDFLLNLVNFGEILQRKGCPGHCAQRVAFEFIRQLHRHLVHIGL